MPYVQETLLKCSVLATTPRSCSARDSTAQAEKAAARAESARSETTAKPALKITSSEAAVTHKRKVVAMLKEVRSVIAGDYSSGIPLATAASKEAALSQLTNHAVTLRLRNGLKCHTDEQRPTAQTSIRTTQEVLTNYAATLRNSLKSHTDELRMAAQTTIRTTQKMHESCPLSLQVRKAIQ